MFNASPRLSSISEQDSSDEEYIVLHDSYDRESSLKQIIEVGVYNAAISEEIVNLARVFSQLPASLLPYVSVEKIGKGLFTITDNRDNQHVATLSLVDEKLSPFIRKNQVNILDSIHTVSSKKDELGGSSSDQISNYLLNNVLKDVPIHEDVKPLFISLLQDPDIHEFINNFSNNLDAKTDIMKILKFMTLSEQGMKKELISFLDSPFTKKLIGLLQKVLGKPENKDHLKIFQHLAIKELDKQGVSSLVYNTAKKIIDGLPNTLTVGTLKNIIISLDENRSIFSRGVSAVKLFFT